MPKIRNGSKVDSNPGHLRLRVRHSTTELPRSTKEEEIRTYDVALDPDEVNGYRQADLRVPTDDLNVVAQIHKELVSSLQDAQSDDGLRTVIL